MLKNNLDRKTFTFRTSPLSINCLFYTSHSCTTFLSDLVCEARGDGGG